jgi:fatty-acyl-CoA synthase
MSKDGMLRLSDVWRGTLHAWKKAPGFVHMVGRMLPANDSSRRSLGRQVERAARRHPSRIAVTESGRSMTYGAFNALVNRYAHTLRRLGLVRGDVAAVVLDNRIELLAVVAALAKLGATASMINTSQRGAGLDHSLSCAPPAAVVLGAELEAVRPHAERIAADSGAALLWIADGEGPCPAGWVDLDHASSGAPEQDLAVTRDVRMGESAFLVFTSGTTGMPKASRMSHLRWIGAGYMFGSVCLRLKPSDVLYCPLPLYHNIALTLCWSSVVRAGAALAIRRRFSATGFWDDCRQHGATIAAYVGEIPSYLVALPPSPADRDHGVRKVVGIGLHPKAWSGFKARFGVEEVYEFYSASELNAGFFNILNLDGTVGFCLSPWALVSFDPETSQPTRDAEGRVERVGPNEVGLMLTAVTDRFRFEGYTDAQATERKLVRGAFVEGDCWINTGDLMRCIGFGHAQFVDRIGDTYRWKSENVATTEVEAALCASSDVQDAAVFGVVVPQAHGRAGMAAVVPDPSGLDLDALLDTLRRALPPAAVPVFLRTVGVLPTTSTFKHVKGPLKAEGFDLGEVADPLFVLLPEQDRYVPLTPALFGLISAGQVRL